MAIDNLRQEVAQFWQGLQLKKSDLFNQAGVVQSSFFNGRDLPSNVSTHLPGHGFFTPYQSRQDLRAQARAPIVMPLICLVSALNSTLEVLKESALGLINLPLLDFSQSGEHFKRAFKSLLTGLYFAASTIYDAVCEGVALITRFVVPTAKKLAATERQDLNSTDEYPADYTPPVLV